MYFEEPYAPPLRLPFRLTGGIGMFGTRRYRSDRDPVTNLRRLTYHQGVDLFSRSPLPAPDIGYRQDVYAITWGRVVRIDGGPDQWDLVLHLQPFERGLFAVYRHLDQPVAPITVGADVISGERLGTYTSKRDSPHLHFEIRKQVDPTNNSTIPVDPTPMLYRFEAEGWPHARNTAIDYHSNNRYRRIKKIFTIPWKVKHASLANRFRSGWLLAVLREGDSNRYYLPLYCTQPHEEACITSVRDAFNWNKRVKLGWHKSIFFSGDDASESRRMIDEVRVRND